MHNKTPTGKITLLPKGVINQIAAGEVVERPASIVKELIENSLDAGSTKIVIETYNGGIDMIRVSDNGSGISSDQLENAFIRHATSKISSVDDLMSIHSYGFRGEALPSIASISKMKIISGCDIDNADSSTFLEISGGEIIDKGPAVLNMGTKIEIKDIFFNVPARLKFLKSTQTENSHIQEAILRFALVNPSVHFKYFTNDRLVFDFSPQQTSLERAKSVLKRRGRGSIRAKLFHYQTEPVKGMQIELVLSPPQISLRDASGVYLFVNNRSVKDRLMLKASTSGYGSLLDRGRYPIAVISLILDPSSVDVNVHPRKTEVRFINERLIAGSLRGAISTALTKAPWSPGMGGSNENETGAHSPTKKYKLNNNLSSSKPVENEYEATRARILKSISESKAGSSNMRTGTGTVNGTGTVATSSGKQYSSSEKYSPVAYSQKSIQVFNTDNKTENLNGSVDSKSNSVSFIGKDSPKYLGIHAGLYLFFSLKDKIIVLDMHATHERIRYSEILKGIQSSGVSSQQLLFPVQITLTPPQFEIASANISLINRVGVECEIFSSDTIIIRSYPAILKDPNITEMFFDILDEIESGGNGRNLGGLLDSLAATTACHSAVRKGDSITPKEAITLFEKIEEVDNGGHCPHGRPVSFQITTREMESKFKRR